MVRFWHTQYNFILNPEYVLALQCRFSRYWYVLVSTCLLFHSFIFSCSNSEICCSKLSSLFPFIITKTAFHTIFFFIFIQLKKIFTFFISQLLLLYIFMNKNKKWPTIKNDIKNTYIYTNTISIMLLNICGSKNIFFKFKDISDFIHYNKVALIIFY